MQVRVATTVRHQRRPRAVIPPSGSVPLALSAISSGMARAAPAPVAVTALQARGSATGIGRGGASGSIALGARGAVAGSVRGITAPVGSVVALSAICAGMAAGYVAGAFIAAASLLGLEVGSATASGNYTADASLLGLELGAAQGSAKFTAPMQGRNTLTLTVVDEAAFRAEMQARATGAGKASASGIFSANLRSISARAFAGVGMAKATLTVKGLSVSKLLRPMLIWLKGD